MLKYNLLAKGLITEDCQKMGKSILVIGAGGHARSVIDAVLSCGEYDKIAVLEDFGAQEVLGYKVIGKVSEAQNFLGEYQNAVVAVGDNDFRLKTIDYLKGLGFNLPCIIHKTAYISCFSSIGEGSVVLGSSIINANVKIGMGVIINSSVTVEHDCIVSDGVHLSPNAVLCGGVIVGNKTWIGSGATVIDHINIGKNVIIGAGSVVIRNICDNVKAYGNPARIKGE